MAGGSCPLGFPALWFPPQALDHLAFLTLPSAPSSAFLRSDWCPAAAPGADLHPAGSQLWPCPPALASSPRLPPHPPLTQASPLLLSPSLTMPGSRASTASASAAVSAARPRQHQKSMSASVHPNKATGLPPTDSNCEVPRPRQVCWGS